MEKKSFKLAILIATGLVLLLIIGFASYASDVTGARYSGTVRITSNSTSSTENVCAVFTLNMPNLLSLGYADNSDDFVMLTNAGAPAAFMPSNNSTNPWCVYVPLIGKMYSLDYRLYSGNTSGGKIRYFPGPAGMSITDNETIEPGDNFTIGWSGFIDTTRVGDNIIDKTDFRLYISESGNVTALINPGLSRNTNNLDYVPGNNDSTVTVDHADFEMTDGAGSDKACTVIAWVNFDDATARCIVAKYGYEWILETAAADELQFLLLHNDASAYIGRKTAVVTGYENTWIHVAATYDGGETSAGVNIYINGADVDNADVEIGLYTGMTGTARPVEIGVANSNSFYMDGGIAEVKVYKDRELSPAEVLADYQTHTTDTTSLVGYWKLDEGVDLPQDSSGNGHHATSNTADWDTDFVGFSPDSIMASGISSGEVDITVSGNTTHVQLYIDGSLENSGVLSSPIKDNSANWTVCSENVTPFMENFFIQVDGATTCNISWQYTTGNFTDASGYGNDAVPSYRTTTSDSDITASLLNFEPVTQSRADPDDVSYEGEIVDELPEEPTTMYTETTSPGIFFAPLVNPLLDAGNVDRTLFWYPFAYVIAILFGILTFRFTQSLLLQAIVEGAFILLFALPGINVYGAWTVIYFGLEAFGVIIMSKHFTW